MRQEIYVEDEKVMVNLSGSLFMEEAALLRQKLLLQLEKGYNRFVVNLSRVDYIDSSGLGVLVAVHKRAMQNGGTVILIGMQGTVKELFELTRLDKVFDIR